MARIVLGMGTSHGPMLSTPASQWHQRVEADRARRHPFRGATYSFDELVALRRNEGLAEQCSAERRERRFAECRAALEALRATWARVRPDVAVLVGNDQMEVFGEDHIPAFALHYGASMDNVPYTETQRARLQPGLAIAEHGHHAPDAEAYPGHPVLAEQLLRSLVEEGFDLAALKRLPEQPQSYSSGLPHAYGFVYRQIIRELVCPAVLVFVNTFYPPNQPSARRCFTLGEAIARAIARWPAELRVAVVGTGGMSHFVVDEQLDRGFLDAIARRDRAALLEIPEALYQSGSSELKNWLPLAGALHDSALPMQLKAYVPCYRSEAGTGSGMAFAHWG
jgi:OH-DDVA oxygenase/3-O-methylgallate 3,4-dioxygenase